MNDRIKRGVRQRRSLRAARQTLSEQLREIIVTRSLTAYGLGQDADVDAGVISRFLSRRRGLTLDTVDRLAAALGLRLAEDGRGRGRADSPLPADPLPAAHDAIDTV